MRDVREVLQNPSSCVLAIVMLRPSPDKTELYYEVVFAVIFTIIGNYCTIDYVGGTKKALSRMDPQLKGTLCETILGKGFMEFLFYIIKAIQVIVWPQCKTYSAMQCSQC